MMSPFPRNAFYVKFVLSILDILDIDYDYLTVKRVLFGIEEANEEATKLASSICKAWNYLFLSRKKIKINDLHIILKILDKNSFFRPNGFSKNKEILSLLSNDHFSGLTKIFNLVTFFISENRVIFKIYYLLILNICILNHFNQYFVFPRDFFKNVEVAVIEKKQKEFEIYLLNKINESKETFDLFNIIMMKKMILKNLDFFNEKNVKQIRLFGSAIDGTFHSQSDIDIIIEFDRDLPRHQKKMHLAHIANFLFEQCERAIDIHSLDEFDTASNKAYLSSVVLWKNL